MKKLMLLAAVPALILGLAACDDKAATDTDAATEMTAPAPVPPPVVPAVPAEAGTPVDAKPMNTEGTNPASPTEVPPPPAE